MDLLLCSEGGIGEREGRASGRDRSDVPPTILPIVPAGPLRGCMCEVDFKVNVRGKGMKRGSVAEPAGLAYPRRPVGWQAMTQYAWH